MRVLIVGYGSMGHNIEQVLAERGHEVAGRVDPVSGVGDHERVSPQLLAGADAVIEFAHADGVVENAQTYAEAGVPAIVGTTGWEAKREEVKHIIEERGGTYLWGSNFSVGAHLFFNLIQRAAALVNDIPAYDIMVMEMHHNRKKDSPSGTAITIGDKIIAANSQKKKIVDTKLDRRIEPDELHIASLRGGSTPGVHAVFLDSTADTIELKHTARNRSGFALGAVMAAEWLPGKKGFLRVEDFMADLLSERSST